MRVRVFGLGAGLDTPIREVFERAARELGASRAEISERRVARRAIDARHGRVRLVYAVDLDLHVSRELSLPSNARILEESTGEPFWRLPSRRDDSARRIRPVVVGAGPAGIFASYVLGLYGMPPLLLERGRPVSERVKDIGRLLRQRELNPESNVLFGEGGAGTFSDGKLRTNLKSPYLEDVLRLFVECGAPSRILVDARPHIGTNFLWKMIERLRRRLEGLGVEIRFSSRVDKMELSSGRARVFCGDEGWETDLLILATGHSARGMFGLLRENGVPLEAKPFQIGVRVEHPREHIDALRYGKAVGHPALGGQGAEYRLHAAGVSSFCMCPGGMIVPAFSEPGHLCLNGMSLSDRRHPFSNSGLVTTILPEDLPGNSPLRGVAFQESLEVAAFDAGGGDWSAPACGLEEFAGGQGRGDLVTSYRLGLRRADFSRFFPSPYLQRIQEAVSAFDRLMPGFVHSSGVVLGPEARCSSPVRVPRDRDMRSVPGFPCLYPIGEGPGYAGGIMSAALDGIRTAITIATGVERRE